MGKIFGRMAYMRNIVQYQLAPNEQNIWSGFFVEGSRNLLRRVLFKADVVGIPIGASFLIYLWGEAEYVRLQRKNPKDYENDQ